MAALALALGAQTRVAPAQVPFDACRDRDDQPIPVVVDHTMPYAGRATVQNGRPVILWNAGSNRHLSRTEQIFIFLHECAHHTLGHLFHTTGERRDELEADCWAIQIMVEGDMVRRRELEVLERSRSTVRGDPSHLGGEAHVRSLGECLAIRTDAKRWAAALDTAVRAAQDSFAHHRGRMLELSRQPIFEALVDLPGTFDCEIVGDALRCVVFAARKPQAAGERYGRLLRIIQRWLPPHWTSTERNAGERQNRTFLAQDSRAGTLITLSWQATRVFVLVKRAPV